MGNSSSQPSNPTSTAPPKIQRPQTGGGSSAGGSSGSLWINAKTLNFGNVEIGDNDLQTVTLSNSGNSGVSISNVIVSGPGIDISGVSVGLVLAPQQTVKLNVTFAPATTGSVAGSVDIASDATNSATSIRVSGTGFQAASLSVDLIWDPSTSTDVVGYDVYRGPEPGGPYTMVTPNPVTTTSYSDTGVLSGQNYCYVVTAVDSSNVQSIFSNVVLATVP